mmetsp:Transcript_40023/g.100832  ORF Transcript_40023/g.100832 Transcript_40023/m.100832 type:complete len:269 (+) Transcript_40023:153-959(+)|eukprot:CAMPEP_0177659446 /NCGR_PEP_ID=MMETSP0447-20121125/17446_1 /TAXON_ID=0 /ORGANISM="Stygamoeba regulata, Strain BSH-02190019" /LENGTH=268 /DNA_ID=CAMNT_0019164315 /DNA_START=126 /DNA_END=932 /DNA_ORIENTATION=-
MSSTAHNTTAPEPIHVAESTKRLVQESFAKLLDRKSGRAGELTEVFYERFFDLDPAVKHYFEGADMVVLGKALAGIIAVMVKGLDDLPSLAPKLLALGKRHAIYGVKEEHYANVGPALIYAMEKVIGQEFDQDQLDAWHGVLDVVAGYILQGSASLDGEESSVRCKRQAKLFVFHTWRETYYRLTATSLVRYQSAGESDQSRARAEYPLEEISSLELAKQDNRLLIHVEGLAKPLVLSHSNAADLAAWKEEIEWRQTVLTRAYRRDYA